MLKRSYFRKITNSSNILDILMDKFKNNTNFYSIRKNDNQIETTYKEYDYSGIALSIKLTVYDQGIRVNISVDETIRILFIATIIIHPVLYIANVYLNFLDKDIAIAYPFIYFIGLFLLFGYMHSTIYSAISKIDKMIIN